MQPKDSEWNILYRHLQKVTGLDFHQYKAGQLQRRMLNFAKDKGCENLTTFWTYLSKDKEHIAALLDKLAINVTELFRNREKWEELIKDILPEITKGKVKLKIWSAGSSYGAEATTLAMVLKENFKGKFTVLGTDIDQEALAKAKKGEYTDTDVREVPEYYKSKYLIREKNIWKREPNLNNHIQFKRGNLLEDTFDTQYDLILCRNVVIYFTLDSQLALYKKFFDALRPGGYLFIGSTERIAQSEDIGFQINKPFFYKKPEKEQKVWQNVS